MIEFVAERKESGEVRGEGRVNLRRLNQLSAAFKGW